MKTGLMIGVSGSLLLVAVLALSAGCGPLAYLLHVAIPPKVDAMYEPPKTPMLVFVESRNNPGMLVSETDQLTAYIMDDLTAFEVAPLIDLARFDELRTKEKNVDKMTISQIGKAVGASQVLYVDLQRVSVGGITGVPSHGRMHAQVHVVDVASGKTMFPKVGESGWPVEYETPVAEGLGHANFAAIQSAVLRAAGTRIGRLFHDYNPEE